MANEAVTLLQHVGTAILGFFKKAGTVVNDVVKEGDSLALAGEPIVDLAFPSIAPLYNMVAAAVGQAEATGQAALSSATGGGTQKLATVIAALEPVFVAYYQKEFGVTPTLAQIEAYVNAIVASLNALPAPAATVAA